MGALAEFHWVEGDVEIPLLGSLCAATAGGAFRFALAAEVWPVGIGPPAREGDELARELLYCLPRELARMAQRHVLTEIDADHEAIQPIHRSHRLFDLGLGIEHVDACVRTDDEELLDLLRADCGRVLLSEAPATVALLTQHGPHRVFCSRLGRIEVLPGDRLRRAWATDPIGTAHPRPARVARAADTWCAARVRLWIDVAFGVERCALNPHTRSPSA